MMKTRRGVRFAATTLIAAGWSLVSCRHFDVCGSEALRCEVTNNHDGGSSGRGEPSPVAGAPVDEGAAGAPAGTSCVAPHADCDGSTLTVCETDTSRSPSHCGKCQGGCAGVCAESECTPFTVLASEVYDASESIAVDRNFVFFAARPAPSSRRRDVLRLDRATGKIEVLSSQAFEHVDGILVVGLRVYLRADSSLWSMGLAGEDLHKEAFDAKQLTTFQTELYFVETEDIYRRAAASATPQLVTRMGPGSAMISGDAGLLVIGSNDVIDEQATYAVYQRRSPELDAELIETGHGWLAGVLAADGRAFWLLADSDGEPLRLRGGSVELALGAELDGVAVADDLVAIAWSRGHRHGLRLVPLVAPEEAVEFETIGPLAGLHFWEDQLWFYDTKQRALVRISPFDFYRLGR